MQITPEFLDSLDEWVAKALGAPSHHAESIFYVISQGCWRVTVTDAPPSVSLLMSDQEFRKRITAWTLKHEEDEKKLKEYLASAQIASEEDPLDRLFEERP